MVTFERKGNSLDASFYSELLAMVDEAAAALAQFEKGNGGLSPSKQLTDIFSACTDGHAVRSSIRNELTLRQINAFQHAVFSFRGPFTFRGMVGRNPEHFEALNVIKREALAIKGKMDASPHVAESTPPEREAKDPYVSLSRISDLRALVSPRLDPQRLIRLLEELNKVAAADCPMATAMLVRAILDHVPSVFGVQTFNEVASNFAGTRSFKKSMEHLQGSLRHIADAQLHVVMRSREDEATANQVNFRNDLEVLLGEVHRLLAV